MLREKKRCGWLRMSAFGAALFGALRGSSAVCGAGTSEHRGAEGRQHDDLHLARHGCDEGAAGHAALRPVGAVVNARTRRQPRSFWSWSMRLLGPRVRRCSTVAGDAWHGRRRRRKPGFTGCVVEFAHAAGRQVTALSPAGCVRPSSRTSRILVRRSAHGWLNNDAHAG